MNEEAILSEREKEALKFLERDFNQCFIQMRHIDTRMFDILRFIFSAYTLLISISLGIYKYNFFKIDDIIHSIIFVLAIGLLVGVFMFGLAIRNRSYFVKIARYINEQRDLFLKIAPQDITIESDFFRNRAKPLYFDRNSLQIWLIFLIAFLNSVLFGLMVFLILKGNIICAFSSGSMFFVALSWPAVIYLKSYDK